MYTPISDKRIKRPNRLLSNINACLTNYFYKWLHLFCQIEFSIEIKDKLVVLKFYTIKLKLSYICRNAKVPFPFNSNTTSQCLYTKICWTNTTTRACGSNPASTRYQVLSFENYRLLWCTIKFLVLNQNKWRPYNCFSTSLIMINLVINM